MLTIVVDQAQCEFVCASKPQLLAVVLALRSEGIGYSLDGFHVTVPADHDTQVIAIEAVVDMLDVD